MTKSFAGHKIDLKHVTSVSTDGIESTIAQGPR
jgi:hypothetical protein